MPVYYVKGSGAKVTLTDKNFVAKGGEKSVYSLGGTAYCVYHDQKAAIPAGKIAELSVLDRPEIVRPLSELLDSKQQHCGETMPFVTDSAAPNDPAIAPLVLCQLFTNSFRRKHGITNDHVAKITDAMLSVVPYCHQRGVVLVDPNETNWLVKKSLDSVFLIDTSCCQTASYPGTAIKPAIHDWNAGNKFTPESDYFSLAVVLGWLWVGIHPYLAHNRAWAHLDANTAMEPRMRANCSFFDPQTEFNRACRPLDEMPSGLRNWMKSVLQDGKRCPPPKTCGDVAVIVHAAAQVVSSKAVTITGIERFKLDIVRVFEGDCSFVAGEAVGYTPLKNKPVCARVKGGMLALDVIPDVVCRAKAVIEVDGRILAVSDDSVSEVVFNENSDKLRATLKHVGSIANLPTTKVFTGCVLQNILGRYLLSLFPEPGRCEQHQLRDLEGWQVLDAKYERGVFMVMVESGGKYKLWRYRLDGQSVDSSVLSTEFGDVNFAVTNTGVCAAILPNGDLVACRSKPGTTGEKKVAFPSPDMTLHSRGANILGSVGPTLYRVTLS